jgi:hypothetical protein
MQSSNYTQALKDQGLRAPSELNSVYDINPMGGGRIVRDRLWFYATFRQWGNTNTSRACGTTRISARSMSGRTCPISAGKQSTTV